MFEGVAVPPTVPALGKIRRMTRMADDAGFIRVAAIDHPENYLALFDPDVSAVGFAEVVESKAELVAAMAEHASALLLDPIWSLGQGIYSGIIPGRVGIISGIEKLSYAPGASYAGWSTELAVRPHWPVSKVAAIGADGAKIVVFYRSELAEVTADQLQTISELVRECAEIEMPLIVEPIWYPLPGEDPRDPAVASNRVSAIIESAATFADLGVDVMKVEFPGSVDTADARAAAGDACAELDDGISVPWVLLSAGVGFDDFSTQVEIASAAGASGFMAGRAIWGDGVGRHDESTRRAGAKAACERLDLLAEIVGRAGRPIRTRPDLAETIAALPADWHENWRE
jgi:tagatose-1,6-bisphosphate aldolase